MLVLALQTNFNFVFIKEMHRDNVLINKNFLYLKLTMYLRFREALEI